MPTEDLILSALENIQTDVREIRDIQKDQNEKISDLCTRTALNEKDIHNVIDEQVKKSTVKFKVATIIFGIIASISSVLHVFHY